MSLKKSKFRYRVLNVFFFNSVVGIIIGTLCTYTQGVEIFVGTLCTSSILLINVISWIIVVGKIISTVRQKAILYNGEFQSQIRNDVIAEASEKETNSEEIDKSFWKIKWDTKMIILIKKCILINRIQEVQPCFHAKNTSFISLVNAVCSCIFTTLYHFF